MRRKGIIMTKQLNNPRKSCRDIWNAFMCEGAKFSNHDIPYCPTTATSLPESIITWEEAKQLYKKALARKDADFHCNAFVCFYIDDYKFDGARGIWNNSTYALKVLWHNADQSIGSAAWRGVILSLYSEYNVFIFPFIVFTLFRVFCL